MSPNCANCNRGQHSFCDDQWCECRNGHGMKDAVRDEWTYEMALDSLNEYDAVYSWTNGKGDGTAVTFSLPRREWEARGRPAILAVGIVP